MKDDFSPLEKMVYPGRGIIVGLTPSENPFIGYFLTGRSKSSQARRLVYSDKTGIVRTEATDKEQLEKGNSSLLLYPALAYVENMILASNGIQTELLYSAAVTLILNSTAKDNLIQSFSPKSVMANAFSTEQFRYDPKTDTLINITEFEPDEPNNTPRINACIQNHKSAISIFKRDGVDITYTGYLKPGRGKLITTYKGGNEDPLLPFEGDPINVKVVSETPVEIVKKIYNSLNDFKVSAAVIMNNKKTKSMEVAIINKDNGNTFYNVPDLIKKSEKKV